MCLNRNAKQLDGRASARHGDHACTVPCSSFLPVPSTAAQWSLHAIEQIRRFIFWWYEIPQESSLAKGYLPVKTCRKFKPKIQPAAPRKTSSRYNIYHAVTQCWWRTARTPPVILNKNADKTNRDPEAITTGREMKLGQNSKPSTAATDVNHCRQTVLPNDQRNQQTTPRDEGYISDFIYTTKNKKWCMIFSLKQR